MAPTATGRTTSRVADPTSGASGSTPPATSPAPAPRKRDLNERLGPAHLECVGPRSCSLRRAVHLFGKQADREGVLVLDQRLLEQLAERRLDRLHAVLHARGDHVAQ